MSIKTPFALGVLLSITPALIYALGETSKAAGVWLYLPAALYIVCMWAGYLLRKRTLFIFAACAALAAVALAAGCLEDRTLSLLNLLSFGCAGLAFLVPIMVLAVSFASGKKNNAAGSDDGLAVLVVVGSGAMIAAMIGVPFL